MHLRTDFTGVTETPGNQVSAHAASMALSRYELVRRIVDGKQVLEIACGSGQGLGYVAASTSMLVGGDVSAPLLSLARAHYGARIPLVRFDAHTLPFREASFDVIQIHEAIYYMARPADVFSECRRVLCSGGLLVVSSVNPEWADFNPSAFSTGYLDADTLRQMLEREFDRVEMAFGFPTAAQSESPLISAVKRLAVRLGVIPRTMKGKRLLKRLFLGPLITMPAELVPGIADIDEPVNAPLAQAPSFRIIYAIAHR